MNKVLQVVQVMQVLQVVFSTDPLLHLFTLFSSRPDSYRELPAFTHPLSLPIFIGIPKGEKLLQMEVTAQFVYQISRATLHVPLRYNNVITYFGLYFGQSAT